jgi:hypothetical protein
LQTYKLENGIIRVPSKSNAYKNRTMFSSSILEIIDTSVVYEELAYDGSLRRNSMLDGHEVYGCYRFYSNGNLSYFVILRDFPLDTNSFNPLYSGYRGVYYLKNGKILADIYVPVNGVGSMGKSKEEISVSGDTLVVKLYQRVDRYVKRKLPLEYMKFKANW